VVKEWLRGCNVILTVSKHWALTGRGRGIAGGSDVRTGMMRMKETHREREKDVVAKRTKRTSSLRVASHQQTPSTKTGRCQLAWPAAARWSAREAGI